MDNKFMHRSKKQILHSHTKSFYLDKARQPIRAELQKKYTNPESLTFSNYKKPTEQLNTTGLQDFIRSPFQKDQFLHRSYPTKTCPTLMLLQSEAPSEYKRQQEKEMRKSFSSLQIRENFIYLQQVIADLAEKSSFGSTRKFVNRMEGELAMKCEKIINRVEKGNEAIRRQAQQGHSLTRIFKLCLPQQNIAGMSKQQLLMDVEKAVGRMVNVPRTQREESRQKVKEMREESRLLNSKLQKQSRELHRLFSEQKSKMKQNYQTIYRKIYQESSRYKRELQQAKKSLVEERKQQAFFQNKYQKLFKDICDQLGELKSKCNLLKEENENEKKSNNKLQEQLSSRSQEIAGLDEKVAKLKAKVYLLKQQREQNQAQIERLRKENSILMSEGDSLKSQVELQRSLNAFLQQKFENARKNSANSFLFQLTQKSQDQIQKQRVNSEIEEDRARLSSQKEEMKQFAEKIELVNGQLQVLMGKLSQAESMYTDRREEEQDLNAKIKQLRLEYKEQIRRKQLLQDQIGDEQDLCRKLGEQQSELSRRMVQKQVELEQSEKKVVLKREQLQHLDLKITEFESLILQRQEKVQSLERMIQEKELIVNIIHQNAVKLRTEEQKQQKRRRNEAKQDNLSQHGQSYFCKNCSNMLQKIDVQLTDQLDQTKKKVQKQKSELDRLVGMRQQVQASISELVYVLVRLQSDKSMKDSGLQLQDLDWVRAWWSWMKQTNAIGTLIK